MDKSFAGKNELLFREKYPEIGFHFQFFSNPLERKEASCEETAEDVSRFLAKIDFLHTEVIYLYGLGQGGCLFALWQWLEANPSRAVVVLENNVEAFFSFFHAPHAEKSIEHPRIHFEWLPDRKMWESFARKLAFAFPSPKVQIEASEEYERRFPQELAEMRLLLTRKTVSSQAFFMEYFYPHKLFPNLIRNAPKLADAFLVNSMKAKFAGIPAVICGAGPSLTKSKESLQNMQDKALLFAGGSTIAALSNLGISPHFGLAFDPNDAEYIRIKNSSSFEVPLLYGNRVLSEIFATWGGPLGYIRSSVGGSFETWLEENLGITHPRVGGDLQEEALSVTTLAVSLAVFLGCSPIIFCGVDLAFTGGKLYASGVLQEDSMLLDRWQKEESSENRLIEAQDCKGEKTYTLLKWIMEAESLGSFVRKYPDTQFINASEGGICIPGVSYMPLHQVQEKYCQEMYDLRASVHAAIQEETSLSKKDALKEIMTKLQISAKRTKNLCTELVEELERIYQNDPEFSLEKGKVILLQEEIKEEEAYQQLIGSIPHSFFTWMQRVRFSSSDLESKEYRKENLERTLALWKKCQEAIEEQEELLGDALVRF